MKIRALLFASIACLLAIVPTPGLAGEPITLDLWPDSPPGGVVELPAEADLTKPEDSLIAGRKIIKLGNVTVPQIAVYPTDADQATGAAIVICPGGGHHILAYDLEGTEVAEWLNRQGITGIVLKYRVPFRDPGRRWLSGVQDAQRAMVLTRAHAKEWKLDPERIGMLGFSAGGEITARTAILDDRKQYENVDESDRLSSRPDFAVLIYPGGLIDKEKSQLLADLAPSPRTPGMFFVHTSDDGVSSLNSLLLAAELKKVGVTAETHIYSKGGHGYGLRHVDGLPVTDWTEACGLWLKARTATGVGVDPAAKK